MVMTALAASVGLADSEGLPRFWQRSAERCRFRFDGGTADAGAIQALIAASGCADRAIGRCGPARAHERSAVLEALTPIDHGTLGFQIGASVAGLFDRNGFLAALPLQIPANQHHEAAFQIQ